MVTRKIEKGKKTPAKGAKKATPALSPREVIVTLALAQALGIPHDEESYQLAVRHKEFNPWSHKLQNMHVIPQKQCYT